MNDAIKTILQKNPLSDVFFSKQNIDYLQIDLEITNNISASQLSASQATLNNLYTDYLSVNVNLSSLILLYFIFMVV